MAERGTKRGPKVPDKAKPVVDKRRRSITNEMMRERQVSFFVFFFSENSQLTKYLHMISFL